MHKFSAPNRFNSKTDKAVVALALFALEEQPSHPCIDVHDGEEDLLTPVAQDSKDNFCFSNFGGLVKTTPFQVYRPGSNSQAITHSGDQIQPAVANSFPSNTEESGPTNSGEHISDSNANQKSFADSSSPDSSSPFNPKGILKKGVRTRYSQIGNFIPLQLGENGSYQESVYPQGNLDPRANRRI